MSIIEIQKINMYTINVHEVHETVENEKGDKELQQVTTIGSEKELIKEILEKMVVEELVDIFNECNKPLYRYKACEILGAIYAIDENDVLRKFAKKLEVMSDESIIKQWEIPPHKISKKYATKKVEDFEKRQTVTYSFSPIKAKKSLSKQLVGVNAKEVDLKSQLLLKYTDIINSVISSRNF